MTENDQPEPKEKDNRLFSFEMAIISGVVCICGLIILGVVISTPLEGLPITVNNTTLIRVSDNIVWTVVQSQQTPITTITICTDEMCRTISCNNSLRCGRFVITETNQTNVKVVCNYDNQSEIIFSGVI
jgi:hypothetical protein